MTTYDPQRDRDDRRDDDDEVVEETTIEETETTTVEPDVGDPSQSDVRDHQDTDDRPSEP
jgi:hypothetical protein